MREEVANNGAYSGDYKLRYTVISAKKILYPIIQNVIAKYMHRFK